MADAEEFLSTAGARGGGGRAPDRQPNSMPVAFYQTPPPLVYPTAISRPQQANDYRTYIEQITTAPRKCYSMAGRQFLPANAQPRTKTVDNHSPTRMAKNIQGIYSGRGKDAGQKKTIDNEQKGPISTDCPPPPQHLTGQQTTPSGYYCYQQQATTGQHIEMWNGGVVEQDERESAPSLAKIQDGKNYSTTFFNPNEQWSTDNMSSLANAINDGTRARQLNSPQIAFPKPNRMKSKTNDVNRRKRKVDSEQAPAKKARDQLLIEEDGNVYASL